jgi:hypothetical protein
MLLTGTMSGLDCGFEIPCLQVQAPCHTIVCGQAEAPKSWQEKVLWSVGSRRILRYGPPSRIIFCEIAMGRPSV